jgi:hypothetical protein
LKTKSFILIKFGRKLAVIVLLSVTAIGAFATLGDGRSKSSKPNNSLLSNRVSFAPGMFSLKSGYNFRGSQVISLEDERYININTVVTYQKGNSTYIMPLKKKLFLDKISFNPNAASRR